MIKKMIFKFFCFLVLFLQINLFAEDGLSEINNVDEVLKSEESVAENKWSSPILVGSFGAGLGIILGASGYYFVFLKNDKKDIVTEVDILLRSPKLLNMDKASLEKVLKDLEKIEDRMEKELKDEKDSEKRKQIIVNISNDLSNCINDLRWKILEYGAVYNKHDEDAKVESYFPKYRSRLQKTKDKIKEIINSKK